MRKIYAFAILLVAVSVCNAQTTIVLQPGETASKDASVWNIMPASNFGSDLDFIATAWTNSGDPSYIRGLIEFDLSSIPANSVIQSATLSLYHHTSGSNIGHSQLSGSNACWIRRVIDAWDENTVTWNNQPMTTTVNQVGLAASTSDTASYPNIDVTALITDIYNNPGTSHGMMLILKNEQYYRSLLFGSSGESVPGRRPKLTVTYIPPSSTDDTCRTFTITSDAGRDASVWNIMPSSNFETDNDFIATAWTHSGDYSVVRGLIDFNLNTIPSNAVITSATLSLYYHQSSSNTGHSQLSGSNSSWLRRITTSWNEHTVTWNNQPSYTTQNQVYLPATSNDTASYPSIDVTSLINDIRDNPNAGYGMIFMLDNENYYRSMLFSSSNGTDPLKLPRLEVCYHTNSSINDVEMNKEKNIFIYPDPAKDYVSIQYYLSDESDVDIELYSINGALIDHIEMGMETNGNHSLQYFLNPEIFSTGMYIVKIATLNEVSTGWFVKID